MDIIYNKCPEPTELPCLMKNEFNEIFLVTKGFEDDFYVTKLNCDKNDVKTWKSDLKGYKPLPKGTSFELIN